MSASARVKRSSHIALHNASVMAGEPGSDAASLAFDAVTDAVGSVQQDADAQGKIGLLAEVTDFLGKLVVEDFEIGFIQRRDKLVAAVEHSEEDVDEVYDGGDSLVALLRGFLALRRGGSGLRLRAGRGLLSTLRERSE